MHKDDPPEQEFKFPSADECHAQTGWKDYETGKGMIDCGEFGKWLADAKKFGDGALQPPCHSSGYAFGGPGSHPNQRCDLAQQTGVRRPTASEAAKAEKYSREMGPAHDRERDKACAQTAALLKRMERLKQTKSPAYTDKSTFFDNVCRKPPETDQ
jgi:hypothetical protein